MRFVHRLDNAMKHKTQGTELLYSCAQNTSRRRTFDVTLIAYVPQVLCSTPRPYNVHPYMFTVIVVLRVLRLGR